MSNHTTIEKAEREISEGRLWRAKEILQGRIRSGGYDADIYERYGQVLLRMGDMLEAGKYLFFSGRRTPEYREAIDIYLNRYAAKDMDKLYGNLPGAMKVFRLGEYPEAVREDLQARGYSIGQVQAALDDSSSRKSRSDMKNNCAIAGCLVIAIILAVLVLLGLGTFIEWSKEII